MYVYIYILIYAYIYICLCLYWTNREATVPKRIMLTKKNKYKNIKQKKNVGGSWWCHAMCASACFQTRACSSVRVSVRASERTRVQQGKRQGKIDKKK